MSSGVSLIGSSQSKPTVRKPISDFRFNHSRNSAALRAGADKQRFFFANSGEYGARQKIRQVMMRKQQDDIEQRNEVEEENARNECVLGRDQVKNERADAGDRLPQAEAMLAQQIVLQEIIARPSRLSDSIVMPRTSRLQ